MALSAFDDKSRPPRADELAEVLGDTAEPWDDLRRRIASRFDPIVETWGFSSKSTGWGLRLKHGERAVLYLVPRDGYFLASFALGERAVAAAHASALPRRILKVIDDAPRYAEGRGVRLEVRTAGDVAGVEALAGIKMAN
jgi:hypothetical protein